MYIGLTRTWKHWRVNPIYICVYIYTYIYIHVNRQLAS